MKEPYPWHKERVRFKVEGRGQFVILSQNRTVYTLLRHLNLRTQEGGYLQWEKNVTTL